MKVRLYLPILSLLVTPVFCTAAEGPNLPIANDVVAKMLASRAGTNGAKPPLIRVFPAKAAITKCLIRG